MNNNQIITVAKNYMESLPPGQEFLEHEETPSLLQELRHCAWMCERIASGSMDREKAMRWLCFVQGVLWSSGCKDIPSMKEDNRTKKPIPKPPVIPPPPASYI